MGTSAASEPLNFFIIVIYNTCTSRIYLIDVTHIDNICEQAGQKKKKSVCKLISCEAQEGA